MNIKDPKKAIEAAKNLRRELIRKYLIWNSQSFMEFINRASQILADHGVPDPFREEFASQPSSDETLPFVIVQIDLNGRSTMTPDKDSAISSSDNLLVKIERVKDTLDSILKQLGSPVSQEEQ